MNGSRRNGDADMSKRARITLNPEPELEVESKPNQAAGATSSPETEARVHKDSAAANNRDRPSAPAKGTLSVSGIAKVVLAGLAVAALVLLWKNRRL